MVLCIIKCMRPSLNIPPREELEAHYASGLSLYSVGDIYGVSPSTVKKWMSKYDLARRPRADATREANLRRPQGNTSRGGGGYGAHGAAVEKTRQKRLSLVREHRNERGCQECGERHPAVLDLHHKERSTKHHILRKYGKARTRGWAEVPLRDLEAELLKCEVLCSNCHRIKEWEERVARDGEQPEAESPALLLPTPVAC